jgi:hypothetical protein
MQNLTLHEHPRTILSFETEAVPLSDIQAFPLPGLLPCGQHLALHSPLGILALLTCENDIPTLLAIQQFSPSEVSILTPLLTAYPDYCPHEMLLACFTNGSANVTEGEIERCRKRLHAAHLESHFDLEMRPTRNVISRVRLKLRPLGCDALCLLEAGYLLRAAKSKQIVH